MSGFSSRPVRELLSANRTYYVRSDGSDANSGRSNDAGGAFATYQKAWDTLASKLDFGGKTVTVQGNAATFAGLVMSSAWVGGGAVVLDGGGGTIDDAANVVTCTVPLPGTATLQNVTLQSTAGGATLISHQGAGTIIVGAGVTLGATGGGDHMAAYALAQIQIPSSYTIAGGCREHAFARPGGMIDFYGGAFGTTTTIAADITLSDSFANASAGGVIFAVSSARTISLGGHTVTGTRYSVAAGGVIYTQGGGVSYFPGSVAGGGAGTYA